jgi:hypothetical protein
VETLGTHKDGNTEYNLTEQLLCCGAAWLQYPHQDSGNAKHNQVLPNATLLDQQQAGKLTLLCHVQEVCAGVTPPTIQRLTYNHPDVHASVQLCSKIAEAEAAVSVNERSV